MIRPGSTPPMPAIGQIVHNTKAPAKTGALANCSRRLQFPN
jgi:hypothetical protein